MADKGLKVYTYKDNQRVKKIQIVADYVGAKLEFPPFQMGVDNKAADFLNMNPAGKVPVLDTGAGFVFESNAIATYIARLDKSKGLLGRNDLEAAQVDQWLYFCSNEIEPSVLAWLGPILGYIAFDDDVNAQAQANVKKALTTLNYYLERHTYLVGERMTLADIVVACALAPLYQRVLEPRLRTPHACVNRWFETISLQPFVKQQLHLEQAAWCTVAQKPTKFGEKKAEKKEEKKEDKPKEEKKKEEKKPKEEKKKEEKKPKAKEEDEEEEEEEVKEEKKPNPLDSLPKSTFILDEYKREYSNKKIDESTAYLFEHFETEGYTAFWCKYKYNDELTAAFKSTNLVGGFFQRMEKMHKYAFGQMLIVGTDACHEVIGFWLIRGKGVLPEIMLDVCDVELYDWTPIDWPTVDRALVKQYLNWEGIGGKECLDGKTFK